MQMHRKRKFKRAASGDDYASGEGSGLPPSKSLVEFLSRNAFIYTMHVARWGRREE